MIVYLDGDFLPLDEARISPMDRGFLMADGIYEVTSVLDGKLIDFDAHIDRLGRSLAALDIAPMHDRDAWLAIHRTLSERNGVTEGGVYLQITRGAGPERDFLWPDPAETRPTVYLFAFQKALADTALARRGARIKTVPDLRWKRRDIKTVQLLYSSQAKSLASAEGFDDVWMTEDGAVTEGSSSNVHIVLDGRLVTRPLSTDILHGITRAALLRYAAETGIAIEERPFSVEEVKAADEAFATSATSLVQSVVEIDKTAIGTGTPGPVTQRLREIYIDESRKRAI